jgi:putative FmdB family regulatory protein
MPTYEYLCKSCGEGLEVQQAFTDDALTECPLCEGPLRKVFGSVGITFKGSGFYKTDSRSGSKSSSSAGSEGSSSSGSSTASSSDSSSSDKSDAGKSSSSSSDAGKSSSSSSDAGKSSSGDKASTSAPT